MRTTMTMKESVRRRPAGGEAGFSLVELMVAMTVTLIVSGAIYGLLTSGGNAFQREPELSDRQQNIRVAIDVISRDLFRAGAGLPRFAQVFTRGLDDVGSMGPGGDNTDELSLIAATECGALAVCDSDGVNVVTFEPLSSCYQFPVKVILGCETPTAASPDCPNYGVFWAEKPGAGGVSSCTRGGGPRNGHVNLPPGKAPLLNPPGGPKWDPEWMIVGDVVRYRVFIDTEGIPNLERSTADGQNLPSGASSWEIVARGIEDLQVQYENGVGWSDDPGAASCGINCPAPTPADFDSLVRRVHVRLSARATGGGNLAGQTTSAVGNAVRGRLETVIAPRQAAMTLSMADGDM